MIAEPEPSARKNDPEEDIKRGASLASAVQSGVSEDIGDEASSRETLLDTIQHLEKENAKLQTLTSQLIHADEDKRRTRMKLVRIHYILSMRLDDEAESQGLPKLTEKHLANAMRFRYAKPEGTEDKDWNDVAELVQAILRITMSEWAPW